MSGFSTLRENAPTPPSKQMSSRLLTMKFMQRATSTNQRPNANRTPSSSQPTTPASEPALKKQKTVHTPDSSAPATPATEPKVFASRADIKHALQAESASEALARARRAEMGFGHNEYETEWVLDVSTPKADSTKEALNGANDSESEEDERNGRQTFGGYKRHKKIANTISTPGSKPHTPAKRYDFDDFDSNDEESNSEDGEVDSDDGERRGRSRGGSSKKRKASRMHSDDEEAGAALDRVDLSKTGYAKAKGAAHTGTRWPDAGKANKGKGPWKNQDRNRKGKKRS